MRGTQGAVALAALALSAFVACGKASSQDPGLEANDGGFVEQDIDASGGLSCASADTLAKVCCGSGEPPATACAATWTSEEMCVGGGSFTQTLYPEPCDGLVASNDSYGGGTVTIFDATSGKLVAIVKNNNPGLGLCIGADDTTFVVPGECLTKWETRGTAACTPKSSSSFATYCASLSLPPQTCVVTEGSPPCPLPTECMFPASTDCALQGVCQVPPASCQTQSTACGCLGGGSFKVCDGFATQPVSGQTCADGG